ncbi:Zinc finger protein NUTCRACKER-like [Heracleum sosnowskyi]|uniref:Zinc finger protein NUTCRACKER-like n=1 Tax=Heracleum sosnowskyi TaxID=360622 RepID=A0AAD8IT62_9APIA|nr:Zinc finger protein NUTCRACKER-like [Heracleum sosnowskyi]
METSVPAEATVCSSPTQTSIQPPPLIPPAKKKRNLPGMPDPEAEVIALSPKTLQATNRFICEICNKGFQRDQNLQLHRRGHNLPWKLKQRTSKEIKKRVYSDWKAHSKTCGTREYRCDCGTLFSRRDSFITHRAFCEALAQETAKTTPPSVIDEDATAVKDEEVPPPPTQSSPQPPHTPSTSVLSPVLSIQSSEMQENPSGVLQSAQSPATTSASGSSTSSSGKVSNSAAKVSDTSGVFASIFASSSPAPPVVSQPPSSYLCDVSCSDRTPIEPMSLSLSSLYYSSTATSLFPASDQCQYKAALSATALLQKAAQMGATSSGSFLRGLGLSISSGPTDPQDDMATTPSMQWKGGNTSHESNVHPVAADLGLGFSNDTRGSHLTNLMLGSSPSLYGNRPTTLDLLGLGIGGGGAASSNGYSAFLDSIGGGLAATYRGVNSTGETWDDPAERKPALL